MLAIGPLHRRPMSREHRLPFRVRLTLGTTDTTGGDTGTSVKGVCVLPVCAGSKGILRGERNAARFDCCLSVRKSTFTRKPGSRWCRDGRAWQ